MLEAQVELSLKRSGMGLTLADNETQALMKLKYYKRSTVISASCNESQVSEAKRAETCRTNYPTCEAKWDYINDTR